ncbi:murein DD-endopeptidase MepM/ murein hydrolase activator NlpD [Tepidamorphus gemmatus]|uniref:Murein DD-endopeptidase MepM/ murein hydrolase activator NlpD n=1 Tax=Tepidamorphus gemmatus TaxID=747076 RepID=A0A4R3MKN9_9HYPH|nr:peptidoglycan DD-metalloendopeptidase family protein [Tepidamorphus gemmatus]TCT12400.1 murein DD-endopeptidase MepM/ murein hydrolase activator NlpD [Tepidamorphus gemmatus]
MRKVLDNLPSSLLARIAILGAAGMMVAGCSSDSTRFGSFFGGSFDQDVTGSITPTADVTNGRPASNPLAQPAYGQLPVASAPLEPSDGTSVVVGPGETVFTIANRYGVPTTALMKVNNITDPNAVPPGQRLVIPVFSQAHNGWVRPEVAGATVKVAGPTPASVAASAGAPVQTRPAASGGTHTVTSGETVYSLGRKYNVRPGDIIAANNLQPPYGLKIGQTVRIPGATTVASAAAAQPVRQSAAATSPSAAGETRGIDPAIASAPAQPPAVKQGIEANALPAPGEQPQQVAYAAPADASDAAADKRAGIPEPAALSAANFRWPARGRIISAFGDKADGGKNDGINISVPEGTSVRAAENGVVAYAGNELKGYGNLVLIRHADDWVTAYAHNSDILVKRGDVVTRGQVIAKAGQTGSVQTPQIHFELRKGSTPVDPLKYLAGD